MQTTTIKATAGALLRRAGTVRASRPFVVKVPMSTIAIASTPSIFPVMNRNEIKVERIPTGTTRNFHATTASNLAERKRRRRRGDSGNAPSPSDASSDNDDDVDTNTFMKHAAVTDPVEFEVVGQATLAKLEAAIEPMKALNDPFRVARSEDRNIMTIEVEPKWGSYVIELDHEDRILVLRSPVRYAAATAAVVFVL